MQPSSFAIYLHVPFCGQRCAYCHFDIKVFHPRTNPSAFFDAYTEAVLTEMTTYARMMGDRPVHSIYAGGGTPSRLPLSHWQRLLTTCQKRFKVLPAAEITVEINPEDADPDYLAGLRDLGVNRLSFGVQSFHDPSLRAIGRPHDAAVAQKALTAGPVFPKGRSLDLILGLPHQHSSHVAADLAAIAASGVEHVSLYLLERDLPTPLDKLATRLPMPDEDCQADFYDQVHEQLRAIGFEHYEISNFAKPGYRSRHNLTYWTCGDYLGLGPAAHGRVGHAYTANHGNLQNYISAVAHWGHGMANREHWSSARYRQESLIQGLRLDQGIAPHCLDHDERAAIQQAAEMGLVTVTDARIRLTQRGRLLANEVFAIFVS